MKMTPTLKTNLLRLSILIVITHILFDLKSFLPIFLANLLIAISSLTMLGLILFKNKQELVEK